MKCLYKIVKLRNVSDTKYSSYKMLGYEMIRLQDRCYELWLQNVRYEMSKLQHVWQPFFLLVLLKQLFFLLLTYAEIKALYWLKALLEPTMKKRTAVLGHVNWLIEILPFHLLTN